MNENNLYDEENGLEEKNSNKKQIMIVVIAVLVVCIAAGGFMISKKRKITNLEKKAENLAEMQDYDEAIKIYSELYTKTDDIKFMKEKKKLIAEKESQEIMKDADKKEQSGDLVKAIIIYKMVPKDDVENYKKAKSNIERLQTEVLRKANSLIAAGNNGAATSILSEYISVVPDDRKAVDLYKDATGKTDTEIEETVVEKTVPVYVTSDPVYVAPDPLTQAYNVAASITNTYQYITSGKANVRSGPSKSSKVIGTLARGDSVYIYDTYVESESRIWCNTDYGWISYNTMNNSIK